MKTRQDKSVSYKVVRSRRTTADIIIERDGSVLVRAPEWINDEQVENIVESRHYWIYQSLAEWRKHKHYAGTSRIQERRGVPVPGSGLPFAPHQQSRHASTTQKWSLYAPARHR